MWKTAATKIGWGKKGEGVKEVKTSKLKRLVEMGEGVERKNTKAERETECVEGTRREVRKRKKNTL